MAASGRVWVAPTGDPPPSLPTTSKGSLSSPSHVSADVDWVVYGKDDPYARFLYRSANTLRRKGSSKLVREVTELEEALEARVVSSIVTYSISTLQLFFADGLVMTVTLTSDGDPLSLRSDTSLRALLKGAVSCAVLVRDSLVISTVGGGIYLLRPPKPKKPTLLEYPKLSETVVLSRVLDDSLITLHFRLPYFIAFGSASIYCLMERQDKIAILSGATFEGTVLSAVSSPAHDRGSIVLRAVPVGENSWHILVDEFECSVGRMEPRSLRKPLAVSTPPVLGTLSSTGSRFAVVLSSSDIVLGSVCEDGPSFRVIHGLRASVSLLAFHPSGHMVVVGFSNGRIIFLDGTGQFHYPIYDTLPVLEYQVRPILARWLPLPTPPHSTTLPTALPQAATVVVLCDRGPLLALRVPHPSWFVTYESPQTHNLLMRCLWGGRLSAAIQVAEGFGTREQRADALLFLLDYMSTSQGYQPEETVSVAVRVAKGYSQLLVYDRLRPLLIFFNKMLTDDSTLGFAFEIATALNSARMFKKIAVWACVFGNDTIAALARDRVSDILGESSSIEDMRGGGGEGVLSLAAVSATAAKVDKTIFAHDFDEVGTEASSSKAPPPKEKGKGKGGEGSWTVRQEDHVMDLTLAPLEASIPQSVLLEEGLRLEGRGDLVGAFNHYMTHGFVSDAAQVQRLAEALGVSVLSSTVIPPDDATVVARVGGGGGSASAPRAASDFVKDLNVSLVYDSLFDRLTDQ